MDWEWIIPVFKDESHGLVHNFFDWPLEGKIFETFDGGETWSEVNYTGPMYFTDLAFVPGTENIWVSTGGRRVQLANQKGASVSYDGGHTWEVFPGTEGATFRHMVWVSPICGWAGGYNISETEGGVFKFVDELFLPWPTNLEAEVIVYDVHLNWEIPSYSNPSLTLMGYNIYRDGVKLNTDPIIETSFIDPDVNQGLYKYCVTAIYNEGESNPACIPVDVVYVSVAHVDNNQKFHVYPNPFSYSTTIEFELDEPREVEFIFMNQFGQIVDALVHHGQKGLNRFIWNAGLLPAGVYVCRIIAGNGSATRKVVKFE